MLLHLVVLLALAALPSVHGVLSRIAVGNSRKEVYDLYSGNNCVDLHPSWSDDVAYLEREDVTQAVRLWEKKDCRGRSILVPFLSERDLLFGVRTNGQSLSTCDPWMENICDDDVEWIKRWKTRCLVLGLGCAWLLNVASVAGPALFIYFALSAIKDLRDLFRNDCRFCYGGELSLLRLFKRGMDFATTDALSGIPEGTTLEESDNCCGEAEVFSDMYEKFMTSGSLDAEELFTHLVRKIPPETEGYLEALQTLEEAMESVDENNDGRVDLNEFKRAFFLDEGNAVSAVPGRPGGASPPLWRR